MNVALQETAERLRAELASGEQDAVRRLADFADRFAVERRLAHRALLLNRRFRLEDDTQRQQTLLEDSMALVDEIVAGHRTGAGSEELARRHQALEQARSRAREQEPARRVIFRSEELGKTYRKSGFTLSGASLELRSGEITGVVGRNGNGKTTLFRLVAGELRHDRGTLAYPELGEFQEYGLDWVRIKEHIAYVPQELPRWYGSLRNNLHYEAALHGLRGEENEREVAYIVQRLDLGDDLDKRWTELAGGFKLRFALAKALVWRPKLLLLDEPLASLDFKAQEVLLKDIRDLAGSLRYPIAVLISSQHLHEVEVVSDNIVFLRQGDVVYNGPMAGVGENRKHNFFELGAACDLPTLRGLLADPGYLQVYHSGISFVVRADLAVTAEVLMRKLLDAGVEVEYFRDISRSTKQLFEESENASAGDGV